MLTKDQNSYKNAININNDDVNVNQSTTERNKIDELLLIMSALQQDHEEIDNSLVQNALQTSLAFLQTQIEADWHYHAYENAENNTQRYLKRLQVLQQLGTEINDLCTHLEWQDESGNDTEITEEQKSALTNNITPIKQSIKEASFIDEEKSKADTQDTETRGDASKMEERGLDAKSENQPDSEPKVLSEKEVVNDVVNSNKQHPVLDICLLGHFRVSQDHQSIIRWSNTKAKILFKYLLAHRKRPVAKEVLMDTFWPDISPQAARNNLNVTLYYLRKTLPKPYPSFSHILFKDDRYFFNPNINFRIDTEAFEMHLQEAHRLEHVGKRDLAINEYKLAEVLYQGDFLSNDLYENWVSQLRQQFQDGYLLTLNKLSQYYTQNKKYEKCILISKKILEIDSCDEAIHLRLIQCYHKLGQRHLAVRQYKTYKEVLKNEMGLKPSKTATELFDTLIN